jgi:hypothetical protein
MHDGSLGTIDASNDHYFGGIEERPSNSKDLQIHTPVFTSERLALTAFLKTLSSETPPEPVAMVPMGSDPAHRTAKLGRGAKRAGSDPPPSPQATPLKNNSATSP